MTRPVWAEIDLDNLAHNVREIRRITSRRAEIMAVIKADAYKHGAARVGEVALRNGAECLGVAIVEEGIGLRENGFNTPIIVLGYTPNDDFGAALQHDLTLTIYDYEQAKILSDAAAKHGKRAKIHIKMDTGMGRLGFLNDSDSLAVLKRIFELPGLSIEGVYTHFATADAFDKTYAEEQFRCFKSMLDKLERDGIEIPIRHAANSAAMIDMPDTHLDMVRPGIILYGLYPSSQVNRSRLLISPVMSIKARVASVKRVGKGFPISYGATFKTAKDSLVAVLPLGYADGYRWGLSNNSEVLIKGQRAPVIGRICMDQFMVDVTDIPDAGMGDEAVLMGKQGNEEITAEDIAQRLGTISYEVVCMISERIPKKYISVEDVAVWSSRSG